MSPRFPHAKRDCISISTTAVALCTVFLGAWSYVAAEDLVDALGSNPLTGRAVIERILSFLGLERDSDTDFDEEEDLSEEAAESAVLEMLGADMGACCSPLIASS